MFPRCVCVFILLSFTYREFVETSRTKWMDGHTPRVGITTYLYAKEKLLFIPIIFSEAIIYRFPLGNHIHVHRTNTHTLALSLASSGHFNRNFLPFFFCHFALHILICACAHQVNEMNATEFWKYCKIKSSVACSMSTNIIACDKTNGIDDDTGGRSLHGIRNEIVIIKSLFVACVVCELSHWNIFGSFPTHHHHRLVRNEINGLLCAAKRIGHLFDILTIWIWYLRNNCTILAPLAVHLWNDANKECEICRLLS